MVDCALSPYKVILRLRLETRTHRFLWHGNLAELWFLLMAIAAYYFLSMLQVVQLFWMHPLHFVYFQHSPSRKDLLCFNQLCCMFSELYLETLLGMELKILFQTQFHFLEPPTFRFFFFFWYITKKNFAS
jgi:hypothetical protein